MGQDRYARQIIFPPIGEGGQERLLSSSVLIVGCGAIGSHLANLLARGGVGRLTLVDRDDLELSNLQRQILFDQQDLEERLPKAVAAARKLREINPEIEIREVVADVNPDSVEELLEGVDLLLDGTDNFYSRYLLNDAAVKHGVPWIYGGAVSSYGMTMTVIPRETACLRCLFPNAPPPGEAPTCDTVGILPGVPAAVAAIQATEAVKRLVGGGSPNPGLIHLDLWEHEFRVIQAPRQEDCPVCVHGRYEYLDSTGAPRTAILCGRDAVQIRVPGQTVLSLEHLEERLRSAGQVARNAHLLRLSVDGFELTVFPDARAIIRGTDDPEVAVTIYDRYVGA
ncbi:MAG: ThiF family adenylyltransferase [Anaerolineae bacterium]